MPPLVAALFFGWLPHNDVAYDSRALWMHVAGAVRGTADRIGRLVPALMVGIPVVAAGITVAAVVRGGWSVVPALAGACSALLFAGLGVSSVASAVAVYPATHPGDGAFRQPQRTGARGAFAQGGVLAVTLVLSAPALWQAWRAVAVAGDAGGDAAALWSGVGVGLVVLAAGVWLGGVVFDRRGVDLLEAVEAA